MLSRLTSKHAAVVIDRFRTVDLNFHNRKPSLSRSVYAATARKRLTISVSFPTRPYALAVFGMSRCACARALPVSIRKSSALIRRADRDRRAPRDNNEYEIKTNSTSRHAIITRTRDRRRRFYEFAMRHNNVLRMCPPLDDDCRWLNTRPARVAVMHSA
jgi:hypothetical protein